MTESIERSMFYGAKPDLFEKARLLRNNMTKAELMLWEKLRNKQVLGYRFKAQHPINIFIADFYCHKLKLVIEVDGGIHLDGTQREHDIGREAEMKIFGIKTIRFTNDEVEKHIDKVLDAIKSEVENRVTELGCYTSNLPINRNKL